MATAQEFLARLRGDVGTTEDPRPPANRQRFVTKASQTKGGPWCATFVVARACRVGLRLPSELAYTPIMAGEFRQAGR